MKPAPKAFSAACWLCVRQRSWRFATVDCPPFATGWHVIEFELPLRLAALAVFGS